MTDTASIAGIASLLWQVYSTQVATAPPPEEFSIPSKSGEIVRIERKPSLFIQFKAEDGEFEQFNIGGNYESKEVFVRELIEKVERLRNTGSCTSLVERFEQSEKWIRIK